MSEAEQHAWLDKELKIQRKRTELSKLKSEYYIHEANRLHAIHQIAQLTMQPKAPDATAVKASETATDEQDSKTEDPIANESRSAAE